MSNISRIPGEVLNQALLKDAGSGARIVLGMPPTMGEITDPNNNVFSQTMAYNAPIITFFPGQGKINNSAVGFFSDLSDTEVLSLSQVKQIATRSDKRVFQFEPAYSSYISVFGSLAARLYSRVSGDAEIMSFKDLSQGMANNFGGIHVWANADTSITETISNEFTESLIQNLSGSVSKTYKELMTVLGTVGLGGDNLSQQMNDGIVQNQNNQTGTYQGTRLLLPKMWNGSSFLKQYSLSFKFESMYGDEDSILRDVYLPFLALIQMALPRNGENSATRYQEPFLVRAYCPGYFIVDMGVITNMSIKKTSGDDNWNYRGLTSTIECTLEITDLYPVMMSSTQNFLLDANDAMSFYIDALAGISYRDVKSDGTLRDMMQEISTRSATGIVGAKDAAVSLAFNFAANASTFFRFNR